MIEEFDVEYGSCYNDYETLDMFWSKNFDT